MRPNPSLKRNANGRPPGPVGGTRYISTSPGLASCRCRPLSSNVRHHKDLPGTSSNLSWVGPTRSKRLVAAPRFRCSLEKPMLSKNVLLSILLASTGAFAQDAVQTDGDKYKVIFENECVRLLEYKDLCQPKVEMSPFAPDRDVPS